MVVTLQFGDSAPEFGLLGVDGRTRSLEALR